ncbi:hypothetical protein PR048_001261 [Dryococelus australis]|uniref:Retrotransposon gag domain-containing protein n=1 Tax=Dryococelus australis TaxID=614101 RepID=A0ABQ9IGV8_9NEOP|nr:hypothetical protein PR048_001261 [Dryococelus australis]
MNGNSSALLPLWRGTVPNKTEGQNETCQPATMACNSNLATPELRLPTNSNSLHQPQLITTAHPTATMYHHPAKHWSEEMPKFSGKQNENPVTYIKKMEEYAKLFALNDTDLLRCTRMSLQSTACFWWEVEKDRITNFSGFQESFLLQFWSSKIQSNIRSQPAYGHWDPKKEKRIEEHFSDVYERTRHLAAAMGDELVDVVISQLPITHHRQFTGGVYRDLTEFIHHFISADQLERQASSTNTAPMHNARSQNTQHGERNFRVNTVHGKQADSPGTTTTEDEVLIDKGGTMADRTGIVTAVILGILKEGTAVARMVIKEEAIFTTAGKTREGT